MTSRAVLRLLAVSAAVLGTSALSAVAAERPSPSAHATLATFAGYSSDKGCAGVRKDALLMNQQDAAQVGRRACASWEHEKRAARRRRAYWNLTQVLTERDRNRRGLLGASGVKVACAAWRPSRTRRFPS